LNPINSAFKPVTWPVQNVVAFTTTIHHPKQKLSSSVYGNFNLGLHVGDDEKSVLSNRQQLLNYLPRDASVQWLDQVHGNHVAVINKRAQAVTADASVTQNKNIALAIMTADCLPILISSFNGDDIAAIHGGWKPLSNQVIKHTLHKMNTPMSKLYAWLGPCIGAEKFEVGEDVYVQFTKQSLELKQAFKLILFNTNEKKYLCNLALIAKIQLNQLGIKTISSLEHCTHSMKDDYYSYRRQNTTGRMATIICRL